MSRQQPLAKPLPLQAPWSDLRLLTNAFQVPALPPQGADSLGVSAPLRCFTISAQVGSLLPLPSLLAPKHLGVKLHYSEKGLGEPWACSCTAVLLGARGAVPEMLGTSPPGPSAVLPGSLAAPYQLPGKLQPNPETAPPVFQFVV